VTDVLSPVMGAPPRRRRGNGIRGVIRGIGELFITLGLVLLLFVFYAVYITDLASADKQRAATAELDQQWRNQRGVLDHPIEGDGIAKLYIPSFGSDYAFTVLEGTGDGTLAVGPGHYIDTALPGQPGNFAVAGHRVGKGSPFNDLDLLSSCDALVVETIDQWFVYRVLPLRDEVAGWATNQALTPQCAGVEPLPRPYADVVGKEIVLPSQVGVISPVPGGESDLTPTANLITLTTCHPQFSARERLILHGVLVAGYPKVPGQRPAELTAG
jgi:sortase A